MGSSSSRSGDLNLILEQPAAAAERSTFCSAGAALSANQERAHVLLRLKFERCAVIGLYAEVEDVGT